MCLFTNNCTPPLQLFALSPPSRLPPTPPHIPIPSPMTPTKIAPVGNMPESAANTPGSAGNKPESAGNMPIPAVVMPESTAISSATIPIPPEPHLISSESTVKLGSWHEIVIAKPAIMTASPAITISHPAIRINTISTHAARVSAFAAWVEMVMKVMAVAPLTAYVYPLS